MSIIKEYNALVGSQSVQLATLLLVLIYKQGMAVKLIDMPTKRYKIGCYIRIELLYILRCEQVY